MLKQNFIIYFFIILVVLIFFILGYFVALVFTPEISNYAYEAGWGAAEKRLKDSGAYNDYDKEITLVEGEIKEIRNKKLIVKINPLYPLSDPELDERIINIIDDTKIYFIKEKSQEQYSKEVEAYREKVERIKEEASENLSEKEFEDLVVSLKEEEPDFFIKQETDFSKFKEGDHITVWSDKDIKRDKEFNARVIKIAKKR